MEVERIVSSSFPDYKENTVQEIFNHSLHNEFHESAKALLARLQPSATTGNISPLTESLVLTSASNVIPHILKSLNITCLITVAPELPDTPYSDEVLYHKIDVVDLPSSNILPHLDEAADLVHQVAISGGRTLVYCVAGVSRSASVCIAYMMKYHRMSLLEAYTYVKRVRPRIRPNCGFFKQLIEYERRLYEVSTVKMVFNEFVRMEIPDVYDSQYPYVRKYDKNKNKDRH
ncbi:dual specificity protein phosphatase 18-like [Cylas formicarius]|uniref:dual specificity protein phosphatase 18-like n=1 Tax=Cylas formicarius TaxID=197179 RepID=UPI0029583C3F|nr:dual specificity protein phosphatase 18-like [Cylas formicarius]